MDRVLIVAKTHMGNAACVGGLNLETNQGIRLLGPNGANQPEDTRFNVGQIWDVDYFPRHNITPPHTEDVIVQSSQYVDQQLNLRDFLLKRVEPWQGDPDQLFDGLLVIDFTSGYISQAGGIPRRSTGYWLPDKQLTLTYRKEKSYYQTDCEMLVGNKRYKGLLSIRYVGFADPIEEIPAGTLIRVSLARWWAPSEVSEKRCYLQLSGWYL